MGTWTFYKWSSILFYFHSSTSNCFFVHEFALKQKNTKRPMSVRTGLQTAARCDSEKRKNIFTLFSVQAQRPEAAALPVILPSAGRRTHRAHRCGCWPEGLVLETCCCWGKMAESLTFYTKICSCEEILETGYALNSPSVIFRCGFDQRLYRRSLIGPPQLRITWNRWHSELVAQESLTGRVWHVW